MGRPAKKGLEYFPLDTSWEINMKLLKAKFGLVGIGCMVELYRAIYKEGYSLKWDDDTQLLFSNEHSIDITLLEKIIKFAISKHIFNGHIFEKFGILTSHGIQARWKKIVISSERINLEIDPFINLLAPELFTEEETEYPDREMEEEEGDDESFPIGKIEFPGREMPQSKVKESKVKESKVNMSDSDFQESESDLDFGELKNELIPPEGEKAKPRTRKPAIKQILEQSEELFNEFWNVYPRKVVKKVAYKAYLACLRNKDSPEDILAATKNFKNECEVNKTDEQFIKHPATFLRSEQWKDYLKIEIAKKETTEERTKRIIEEANQV